MTKKTLHSGLCWLWVSVIILILDQATKYFAQMYLFPYEAVSVIPGFNLALSYNTGAAFSFLNSESGWQVWLFGLIALLVSIGIIFWLARLSSREYGTGIALAFVVGGALGNLCDRILHNHVIDFIQLYVSHYYWPTFNIADSAICIGAVILFCQALFVTKKTK